MYHPLFSIAGFSTFFITANHPPPPGEILNFIFLVVPPHNILILQIYSTSISVQCKSVLFM